MPERESIDSYPYLIPMATRWMDNDVYGHVNNVAFYSYFDTAANRYLIDHGLDIHRGDAIGLVVESHCNYLAPVAFPDELRAGVRVDKLGRSAVTYGLAIFTARDDLAVAQGYVVHVFVDRATRESVRIPDTIRLALETLSPV